MPGRSVVCLLSLALVACAGDDMAPPDADAGGGDTSPDGGAFTIAPVARPVLTPCADGFREVELAGLAVTVCEPWPEGGRVDCPPYESHFPGEPGCVPIGTGCPSAGRFASDLPTDARVFYVDRDAATGGDGTLAAPFDDLDAAVRNAGDGQVIAIAPGTYDAAPRLRSGVTLWGACVAETVIAPSAALGLMGAVTSTGEAFVRNLRITGARPGVGAFAATEGMTLDGVWIEGTGGFGVAASNGGRIVVRDSYLGSPTFVSLAAGTTVVAQDGGLVQLARVEIEGARVAAVAAEGEGALATLDHVVIRDALGAPGTASGGRGASASVGARVEIRASVMEDISELGGLSREEGSAMLIEDSVIRRVRAQGDGYFGRGFTNQSGATGTLSRVLVEETLETALIAIRAGVLSATDVVIRRVGPATFNGGFGIGVGATDAELALTRVVVSETLAGGMNIVGESVGALMDVRIVDVRGQENLGIFGRGLNVFRGASVNAERIHIEGSRDVGIFVDDATLDATDLVIEETAHRLCATTSCATSPAGIGLGVYGAGVVGVERFSIARSALAGLQIASDGNLRLRNGEVRENLIGANIQVDGFDIARISDGVVYVDNGTNLDSERLPVPEPPVAVED